MELDFDCYLGERASELLDLVSKRTIQASVEFLLKQVDEQNADFDRISHVEKEALLRIGGMEDFVFNELDDLKTVLVVEVVIELEERENDDLDHLVILVEVSDKGFVEFN